MSLNDRPVMHVRLRLANGTFIGRIWTWGQVQAGGGPAWDGDQPPAWLRNARRSWANPAEPILYEGDVAAGHEAAARAVLA